VKESERDQLRKRVDEAKRVEVDDDRRLDEQRKGRSAGEVKRQAADRKEIFAAHGAHDANREELAIVAEREGGVYLISVGQGRGRVLDLREGQAPTLSAPSEIFPMMADKADWLPFRGDADEILSLAARMIADDS
jgi:hypothetical protein